MNQIIDPKLGKQLLSWVLLAIPILCGAINQIRMLITQKREAINVFVNPPGEIGPIISLGYQWWVVLTFGTFFLFILFASGTTPSLPRRLAIPFYLYLLFLLILVWPV